jgi:hypothetical protein
MTTRRTDWEETHPERLARAHQMPHVLAISRAIAKELQTFETEFFKFVDRYWLSSAEGVQLDRIGALLTEPRSGRIDVHYRLALRVAIRARRSHGKVRDILAILELSGLEWSYVEGTYAAFKVEAFGAGSDEMLRWCFYVRAAGVSCEVVTSPVTKGATLRFVNAGDTPEAGNVFADSTGSIVTLPMASSRRV